ncbi:MAG: LysR family transcriptional regulator [Acidobacteria bacterium]|nr:LysR family transcriptional regulator [Acidobacteriota bacterium]
MDILSLRLFRDLADSLSFTRTAEANSISQSAVSQQIRRLEQQLGVQLIEHHKRPLALTPAGQVYEKACRDILRRYEQMQASLEALKEEVGGPVRVASIYSIGLYDMARHTEEFMRLYPKAKVHIEYLRTDKVYEAVRDGKADVGLLSYPNPSKELRIIPWRREKMMVITSPSHPLAKEKQVSPSALEGQPFVCFDYDLPIRKVIDRYLKENRVALQPVMEFDNIANIKEAVAVGAGISILPEPTVRQEVSLGRLAAITLDGSELVRTIGIIYHRRKKLTPATLRFLELLRREVRE